MGLGATPGRVQELHSQWRTLSVVPRPGRVRGLLADGLGQTGGSGAAVHRGIQGRARIRSAEGGIPVWCPTRRHEAPSPVPGGYAGSR
jgi:hypothetical protein